MRNNILRIVIITLIVVGLIVAIVFVLKKCSDTPRFLPQSVQDTLSTNRPEPHTSPIYFPENCTSEIDDLGAYGSQKNTPETNVSEDNSMELDDQLVYASGANATEDYVPEGFPSISEDIPDDMHNVISVSPKGSGNGDISPTGTVSSGGKGRGLGTNGPADEKSPIGCGNGNDDNNNDSDNGGAHTNPINGASPPNQGANQPSAPSDTPEDNTCGGSAPDGNEQGGCIPDNEPEGDPPVGNGPGGNDTIGGHSSGSQGSIGIIILILLLTIFIISIVLSGRVGLQIWHSSFDKFLVSAAAVLFVIAGLIHFDVSVPPPPIVITLQWISGGLMLVSLILSIIANLPNILYIILSILSKVFVFYCISIYIIIGLVVLVISLILSSSRRNNEY